MSHSPLEKIQALDAIEKEIITCIQSAGQSLQELGKEKTSQKAVENNTQQFLKSLNIIETKLSEQINYLTQVSTGQPHEGSGYASAKVLQMAWHRIQHARSRVRELDDSKNKYVQVAARHQQRQGMPVPTTSVPSPVPSSQPSQQPSQPSQQPSQPSQQPSQQPSGQATPGQSSPLSFSGQLGLQQNSPSDSMTPSQPSQASPLNTGQSTPPSAPPASNTPDINSAPTTPVTNTSTSTLSSTNS